MKTRPASDRRPALRRCVDALDRMAALEVVLIVLVVAALLARIAS